MAGTSDPTFFRAGHPSAAVSGSFAAARRSIQGPAAAGLGAMWRLDPTVRFLVKVTMPVEAGNSAAKDGFSVVSKILEQQKEAAYFVAEGGKRTGLFFINMDAPSELPKIAEPWFLAMNADAEVTPAMTPEDLQKAAPAVAQAIEQFG